jgi:hypothetical protein
MTVKFPIDDVNFEWSMGSNRDVDARHVRQLCQLFEQHGLQRQSRSDRVRLLCCAEDVKAMCESLGIDSTPKDHSTEPPYFEGWTALTSSFAEMLAGNHRIQALKAYLKQRKVTDERERWWICDIFDKGESCPPRSRSQANLCRYSATRDPD